MALREIGAYGEYSLFENEGRYYAASRKMDKAEVSDIVANRKAIEAATEVELIRILKESEKWADTRGLYGLEERDPQNKIHIKVNSFNMEHEAEFEIENPCLFKSSDGLFLVEKDDLPISEITGGVARESDLKGFVFVGAASSGATPELLFEYKKFNIVEYDGVYYGLPISLGPIKLEVSNPKLLDGVLYTGLLKETMVAIDLYWRDKKAKNGDIVCGNDEINRNAMPTLLRVYKEFNIVDYGGVLYGIPRSLGPIRLEEYDPKGLAEFMSGDQISIIISAIDDHWACHPGDTGIGPSEQKIASETVEEVSSSDTKSGFGEFVECYRGYNIFLYEQSYICYPDSHEKIDFSDVDYFSIPHVIYDVSIFAIKELINDDLADLNQRNLE